MLEWLDHLDDHAKGQSAEKNPLDVFDMNLESEIHNITLQGECEFVDRLAVLWGGIDLGGKRITADNYHDAYLKLNSPTTSADERQSAFALLQRLSPQLKAAAKGIIKLNLANMTPVEGRIKELSDESTRLMILLAVLGTAFAVVFTVLVARSSDGRFKP